MTLSDSSIESVSEAFAWGKSNKNRGGSAGVPRWGDVSGVPPRFVCVWYKKKDPVGERKLSICFHLRRANMSKPPHKTCCLHVQMHVSVVGLMFTLECACRAWTHLWEFVFVRNEGRGKWRTGQYPRPSVGTHYELVMVFATHGRLHSLSFPAARCSIHLFSFSLSPGTAHTHTKKIL